MNLSEILVPSLVFLGLETSSKVSFVRFVSEEVKKEYPDELGKVDIEELILERESLSSTGIGSGIAIPHAKIEGLEKHILMFARNIGGIEFDSIDGKQVTLVFLLLSPQNSAGDHLKILAKISKFLHDTSFREKLMRAKTTDEILDAIKKKEVV